MTALGTRFRVFQAAALGSDLADGIVKLALPVLAITTGDSVFAVAAVGVAIRAPWVLVILPAGVALDRYDPSRVMAVASWVRLPAVAAVCLAALAGALPLWGLVAAAFLVGTCGTVVDLAAQALVPRLVDTGRLPSANANLQTGQVVMGQFAGPALAGFLAAPTLTGGIGGAVVCYVLSLAALELFTRRHHVPVPRPRQRSPLWTEMREGMAHFVRRRDLVGLAGVGAANNLGFSATVTILPIWVVTHLDQPAHVLGFVVAAPAVGALATGPIAARLLDRFGGHAVLRAGAPAAGLCFLAVAVPDPVVVAAAMAVYGGIAVVLNVMSVSYRQTAIAPELFGRVNSVCRWLTLSVSPVGAALGGVLATAFGTAVAFVAAGVLTFAAGLVLPASLAAAPTPAVR